MAKKLFESYSKGLLKGAGKEKEISVLDSGKGSGLERYAEWKKKKGVLEILFSFVSEEGNLIASDENGVRIILKKDTLLEDMSYYTPKVGEKLVANAFTVNIIKIDEKNRIVYVKSARPGTRAERATIRSRLVGELFSELKKNHVPRVAGKVEKIKRDKAFVDILGKGILGFCYSKDWGKYFCRYFTEHCKEGEVYEFDVIRALPKKENKVPVFILSRKEIAPDPWDAIPDEYLKPGATITVRCVENPEKKSYWWGVSELLPDIEIQADFTKKIGKLMVGAVYKCTVRKADKENHIFRVVPFALADSDVGTEKAIRFLDPKNIVK